MTTMDKKRIASFKTRIRNSQGRLSVAGDMLLMMDIDHMTQADRVTLQAGLRGGKIAVSYVYLNQKIEQEKESA